MDEYHNSKILYIFNMSMTNTALKINSFKIFLICCLMLAPIQMIISAPATTDIPPAIIDALKSGNTNKLAQFFNTSIELAVPGQEDIFSSQQAELIIKDFFTKHVPTNFTILHKGGKEGSQYAIGNLVTSTGNYRVTLLIKLKDNKPFIHQLRFEEGNAE
jgi:hypothetical protein